MKITWKQNPDVETELWEAFLPDAISIVHGLQPNRPAGWIHKRPQYCDRGHWQAQVEVPNLDAQDAFPRYFMRLATAMQEMEDFLRWRIAKMRVLEPPDTIHALHNGKALCRFSLEKPGDWPPGHKWQGHHDVVVNCPGCVRTEAMMRGRRT